VKTIWKNKKLHLYLGPQVVSLTGALIQQMALNWLISQLTHFHSFANALDAGRMLMAASVFALAWIFIFWSSQNRSALQNETCGDQRRTDRLRSRARSRGACDFISRD
jgi:hypothetical protein